MTAYPITTGASGEYVSEKAAELRERRTRTCRVRWHGEYVRAYADDGRVWVEDGVAGHFTTCHNLTDGQVRYVIGRADRT